MSALARRRPYNGYDWNRMARGAGRVYRAARRHAPAAGRVLQNVRRRLTSFARGNNLRRRIVSQRRRPGPRRVAARSYQGKRLPPGHRSIRNSSRKAIGKFAGKALSLRQITDMLSPLVKHEAAAAQPEITWSSNEQGTAEYHYLGRSALEAKWVKMNSPDVNNQLNSTDLGTAATNHTSTMQYTGGYVEYTVLNSCNHTVEVLFNTFKPKGRHSMTLFHCWENDLNTDDTISNLTVPINIERQKTDYGTAVQQPNNPKSYMKMKYQLLQSKRIVLAVGETYVYKVKHKPFTFDMARENMLNAGIGTIPNYGPQLLATLIVGRSQLVVDGTGTAVAHGSGKVAVAEKFIDFIRGGIETKRYQTLNTGGLDTITDGNQFHYNVDTEAENQYTTS